MKTKFAYTALLIFAGLAVAQDKTVDQLRAGIVEEDVNRNLDKAVEAYQAVLKQFDETRKTAATAAFRLAECYRKQGKRDQAVAAYNRVIREFGDQTNLADQSRSQLSRTYGVAEDRTTPTAERTTQTRSLTEQRLERLRSRLQELQRQYTPNHPEVLAVRSQLEELESVAPARASYRALLEEEIRLVEDQIKGEQRKIDMGVTNSDNLNKLKRDVLALRRALVLSEGAIDPAIEPFPRQVRPK